MRMSFLGSFGVVAFLVAGCSSGDSSSPTSSSTSTATTGSTSATTASTGSAMGGGGSGGAGGGGGQGGVAGSPYSATKLPPLDMAFLVTDQTIVPKFPVSGTQNTDPRDVDELKKMLDMGWGDVKNGPPEQVTETTLDGSAAPTPGANPTLLTRFVHLSDSHISDDESPTRLADFDAPGITNGAFRAHDFSECRILNDAVRTINALNKMKPFDFVLLGGDNADSAQSNELGWFLSILDGSPKVECDSGADNDLVKGPNNDAKDPFFAEGLDLKWWWVTGNHDVLVQGNLVTSTETETSLGDVADTGTRDWSKPGGPVTPINAMVPADPRRKTMSRKEMLTKVNASGDGHGISSDLIDYGKAFYTFDTPQGNIRFVVVDSGAETGGADGVIHQADIDKFVKPALNQAKKDNKLVIVTSHHDSLTLGDGSGLGGTTQADAVTAQQWVDLLGSYGNVLLHLAAHTHSHRVAKAVPTTGTPFWQVETSALVDFPFQFNTVEVWDQDDGNISIRVVPVDYLSDGDPVGANGRKLATADYISSWGSDGSGDPSQRSVQLWIPKP